MYNIHPAATQEINPATKGKRMAQPHSKAPKEGLYQESLPLT